MPGVMPGHLCHHSLLLLSQHTQVMMRKTQYFSGVVSFVFLLCIVSMAISYHCCDL